MFLSVMLLSSGENSPLEGVHTTFEVATMWTLGTGSLNCPELPYCLPVASPTQCAVWICRSRQGNSSPMHWGTSCGRDHPDRSLGLHHTLHHTRWTRLISFSYYPTPLSIDNNFRYSRVHTRYIHGANASARCPNRVEMCAGSNSNWNFFFLDAC